MFCTQCGAENADGTKFCENCGAPLTQEGAQTAAPNNAAQPAPQPQPGAAQPAGAPQKPKAAGHTMASSCPACGGAMVFDPTIGKLKCDFCGSAYTPEEMEAAWKEKAAKTAAEGGGREMLGEDDGMLGYTCSTCGAELMADQNTAVMICPYCGSHTLAPAQFSGSLKPNYIIPFAHTKQEAVDKYHSFYDKRFLLPKSFKTDSHVEEIQGVYVPFWLFDGKVNLEGHYMAQDTSTDKDGHKHVTGRFEVYREGHLSYEKVPADGSRRMDDAIMDSVEPYTFADIKEFSMSYLPGFLAERYDVEVEECRKRAHERAEKTITSQVEDTIRHDEIVSKNVKCTFANEKHSYAMLPVWMLVTKWQEKTYKFAMNGQTGKMVGDLPVSAPKMAAVLVPLFIVAMVLYHLIAKAVGADSAYLWGGTFVFPMILTLIVGMIMYGSMKSVAKGSSVTNYINNSLQLTRQEEKRVNVFQASTIQKEMKG